MCVCVCVCVRGALRSWAERAGRKGFTFFTQTSLAAKLCEDAGGPPDVVTAQELLVDRTAKPTCRRIRLQREPDQTQGDLQVWPVLRRKRAKKVRDAADAAVDALDAKPQQARKRRTKSAGN